MRKTRVCLSVEQFERKSIPSAMGLAPALIPVQVVMIEEGPSLPPSYPPTDLDPTDPTDPTDPSPEPGMPGGPEDPY